MAREYENDCVGCPQGCISCGRKENYLVVSCDECGDEATHEYEGKDYCEACLFEQWVKDGNAEFDYTEDGVYSKEVKEYIDELLRKVYSNFSELEDYLTDDKYREWETFKDDHEINLEEEY